MGLFTRHGTISLVAGALAAAALSSPVGAACPAMNNLGRALIPFTIINENGPAPPLFIYMNGNTDPIMPQNNTYFLSDFTGNMTKFDVNQPSRSYSLQQTGQTTDLCFPRMDGVRIYISVGKGFFVTTDAVGIPFSPGPNLPADPNYHTIWDFVEFTWNIQNVGPPIQSTLGGNVTQVDAFGLAFELERKGFADDFKTPLTLTDGFATDKARTQIFNELLAAGKPWSNLIIRDSTKQIVRALQPIKAIQTTNPQLFPPDQLAAYVTQVKQHYATSTGNKMTASPEGVAYTGTFDGTNFVFPPVTPGTGMTYTIPPPTTSQIYANAIVPSPNDGRGGVIAGALGASFIRSTLLTNPVIPVPQSSRSEYYQNPPISRYAAILHKYAINHHAFAFGYDEVAQDAGLCCLKNPVSIKLTVHPF